MAFKEVELLSSYVPIDAVPRDGVRVSSRKPDCQYDRAVR